MLDLIMLSAHLMGDFILQPSILAEKKKEKLRWLFLHSVIYALPIFLAAFLCFDEKTILSPILIICVSHHIIDYFRIKIDNNFENKNVIFCSFIVDQVIHIAIILFTIRFFSLYNKTSDIYSNFIEWKYADTLILYFVTILSIWTPSSVFIKKLFNYLFQNQNNSNENTNAGNIIGKLERLIISFLVLTNQTSVIGFVLTAKSVARFKQFNQDGFAEKYLVGTLTSAAIAIILPFIFSKYLLF